MLHAWGAGDLQDDAGLLAIIGNVKRPRPHADITTFTLNPYGTQRVMEFRAIPSNDMPGLWARVIGT
jgi:hypothetical protein